jgi:hypothetical protein
MRSFPTANACKKVTITHRKVYVIVILDLGCGVYLEREVSLKGIVFVRHEDLIKRFVNEWFRAAESKELELRMEDKTSAEIFRSDGDLASALVQQGLCAFVS